MRIDRCRINTCCIRLEVSDDQPGRVDGETCRTSISAFILDSVYGKSGDIPNKIVFTANGTRPPYQLRVLMPKETAWAKLSCPRRMPLNRAEDVSFIQDVYLLDTYIIQRYYPSTSRRDSTSSSAETGARILVMLVYGKYMAIVS